jgi:hypothetical protein
MTSGCASFIYWSLAEFAPRNQGEMVGATDLADDVSAEASSSLSSLFEQKRLSSGVQIDRLDYVLASTDQYHLQELNGSILIEIRYSHQSPETAPPGLQKAIVFVFCEEDGALFSFSGFADRSLINPVVWQSDCQIYKYLAISYFESKSRHLCWG